MAFMRALTAIGGGNDMPYTLSDQTISSVRAAGDYYITDVDTSDLIVFFTFSTLYGYCQVSKGEFVSKGFYNCSSHTAYASGDFKIANGKLYYTMTASHGSNYTGRALVFKNA